jgi:lipoyl(octanoyl) transferase
MKWQVMIERNISFERLLEIQEEQLQLLKPNQESMLLFAELKPTITLGSRQVHERAQFERLEAVKMLAKEKQIEVIHGERGGNETWHGPGQWVGFVITPLEKFTGDSKGVRKAVCGILANVKSVVKEYVPDAVTEEGDRMGIWSTRGKVVSVGIKIKGGYITSGFALNCYPHEKSFMGINPCGIEGASADFIFAGRIPNEKWNSEFESIPQKIFMKFEEGASLVCV